MAKTCIVCGAPASSGEHIFPACLGGRRVNNGIYCGRHNNDYGPFAAQLAEQLGFFNAHFGIRNSRTKQIQPVELKDPSTGAKYKYDGLSLKPIGPRILSQNGNQATIAVPNDPVAAENLLRQFEAKGITAQIIGQGKPQTYHPGPLGIQIQFGGPQGLRAIGYVAQTFFAHCFPDLARNPAMQPFIDYTLDGIGDHLVWWDFEAPTDLSPNASEFGHRIIVGADRDRAIAYGRVSLFSTLDFAMVFYDLNSPTASCSVINDIDPMALKMPDDLRQRRDDHAIASVMRPIEQTESLAAAIHSGKAQERHSLLMRRGEDQRRRNDAKALLERVRACGDLAAQERVVREFWDAEPQRVLRLLGFSLAEIRGQNQQGDPAWHLLVECLERATKRDESKSSGLTGSAEAAIRTASAALSRAMAEAIRNGSLDQDKTEMLIGGGLGAHAAAEAVLEAGVRRS